MIFLPKIILLINPSGDPHPRFFCFFWELSVTRRFHFTLRASNEVNCTSSLWTWSINTLMCVASHGSWTGQGLTEAHQIWCSANYFQTSSHPVNFMGLKKKVFLRVSLLLWPAIVSSPVQAYAGALQRGLFTSVCCSLIYAERRGAARDGS